MRVPIREPDIARLAHDVATGLTANAEVFPAPPVAPETDQGVPRGVPPPARSRYRGCGRSLLREGTDWVFLDWKQPIDGGQVAAYKVQRRRRDGGDWGSPAADVAVGYGRAEYAEVNSPWYWPAPQWALEGNGGMVSSPKELYRWIGALRGGKVLGAEGLRILYRGHLPTGAAPAGRQAVIDAGADDFGFLAIVIEVYDGAGVVIVSTNSAVGPPSSLAEDLAAIVTGRSIRMP